MTTLLLSVLAATSLAAAGVGAPAETRSAQSLPSAQLVAASPTAAAAGTLHTPNRLAAAAQDNAGSAGSGESDEAKCEHHGGVWDSKKQRCRRGLAWEVPTIGAATLAGFIYAITSSDGPGTGSISH